MAEMPRAEKPENVQLTFRFAGARHTCLLAATSEITFDEGPNGTTVTVTAAGMTMESERLPLPVEFGTVIEGDYPGRRDRFILLPANARAGGSGWRSFKTGEMVRESHIANWKIIMKGNENG